MNPPAQLPRPRKRFQFSLRTLMIGVIIYCCLWLLTIRVGGVALARHYANLYVDDRVSFEGETAIRVDPGYKFGYGPSPAQIRGRAVTYFPFVLAWRWEKADYNGGKLDEFELIKEKDCYIWFFGFRYACTEHKSARPQFGYWGTAE